MRNIHVEMKMEIGEMCRERKGEQKWSSEQESIWKGKRVVAERKDWLRKSQRILEEIVLQNSIKNRNTQITEL